MYDRTNVRHGADVREEHADGMETFWRGSA
jgi:hypothetical protein